MRRGGLAAVRRAHVIRDDALELLGDALALERDGLLAVDVDGRDRYLAGAGKADADVGHLRFARAVHDAPHHGDRHDLDAGIAHTPRSRLRAQPLPDLVV